MIPTDATDTPGPHRPAYGAGLAYGARGRGPIRRPLPVLAVVALLVATLALGSRFIRLPYETVAPGESRVLNGLVAVKGHDAFPPRGRVLSTTVSVRSGVSPLEALAGWADPSVDVVEEQRIRGNLAPAQYQRLNQAAMADSKTTAKLVALRQLGYGDLADGAEIEAVDTGYPASAQLRVGDVITAVDDAAISTTADAVNAIAGRRPGDIVRLALEHDGEAARQIEAVLGNNQTGGPVLGVRLSTRMKLPFDIKIDSGGVVGPSAGLAYALEVLDVLTPGELTGGRTVAVTGELADNGEVGAIGGVAQKTVSVRRAGAKVFLVPKENVAEARAHAGDDLQIRGVSTFAEALEALAGFDGSNALALGRSAPPG